jgi:DNA polymerase-3 subunit alpha
MSEFIHLHNHSDYSLLDGAAAVEGLVAKAKQLGMPALALTDHGNMFGVPRFFRECRKQGVKPIVGSEFYLAPESRHDRSGGEGLARYYHLVLLAENEQGYKNLLKLSSRAYTEGFYYKPRVDNELLEAHSRGLIALSGCLGGEIPRLILDGRTDQARQRAGYYAELFGKGNFYLELQNHGMPEQSTVIREILELARGSSLPLVVTNDIHYLNKDDALAQDVLICIGTGKKLAEEKRLKFEYPEFYFKTQQEMEQLFPELPEALANTMVIAERCNLEIPMPGPLLPHYQVPDNYTLKEYLSKIARENLSRRYDQVTEEIRERLEYELSVINSMGYTGYFLIVWDFIRFARESGIPVGPGRGSGAGSLVAYSLGITDIDPLKYGLLFERFLNPERVSMPDFDIDFCYEGRSEVIDYVIRKYGKDRVSQIITFGTLKARAVIRDVARVLDLPYAEADSIAKMVPPGPQMDLHTALKQEPELKKVAERGESYRQLLDVSLKLEGMNRHASTHAAGIVIGRRELTDYVPLYRDARTGAISTQYTMDYLEDCGLVKMDFLGLKTLTLIRNTLELLKKRGLELNIQAIPEDDEPTFTLLGEGRSTCIFQFESQGMQEILRKAKPESISDLIALNALYRPGPMEFIGQFTDAKRGRTAISYPLPELEPILKETYGVIVYQEQVMEIARRVAGFSLGEADILRRAMGKKKVDVMARQKEKFVAGAVEGGYKRQVAGKIFDLLVPFAGYGFNKSHAAAYSVLAYQTAFLKANYPAEFMAANLTNEINSTDKLAEYIGEARDMGLTLLPPAINLSEENFTVVDGRIIYGLKGIKNVGQAAVEEIIRERRSGGDYLGFMDLLERVDLKTVNRKVLETLILCGVFAAFETNRATLFHNLDRMLDCAAKLKESRRYGQTSLFDIQGMELPSMELEELPEYPSSECLRYEKQNLGFYFSGHPLEKYRQKIREAVTLQLSRLQSAVSDRLYTLIGILKDLKVINTRNGKKMAFAVLEDLTGTVELVIFSKLYEECREMLTDDRVLAVSGRVDRSRGDAKLKVETVMDPEQIQTRLHRSVHVRFRGGIEEDQESLIRLRDYLIDKSGECTVYFHLAGEGEAEYVVKASAQISMSGEDEVLEKVRQYPQVEEVWKE